MANQMQNANQSSLVQHEIQPQHNPDDNVNVNVATFAAKYQSKRGKYPKAGVPETVWEKSASNYPSLINLDLGWSANAKFFVILPATHLIIFVQRSTVFSPTSACGTSLRSRPSPTCT